MRAAINRLLMIASHLVGRVGPNRVATSAPALPGLDWAAAAQRFGEPASGPGFVVIDNLLRPEVGAEDLASRLGNAVLRNSWLTPIADGAAGSADFDELLRGIDRLY